MGKRIRHPKKKEMKEEEKLMQQEEQQPQEQKQEQPMHFVLDVQDSYVAGLDGFGFGK
jgi:hypothetical protein